MLRLLADESDGLGLQEITGALGLAKATTHGLLRTLQEVGFVEQRRPGGVYHLVPGVLQSGLARWDPNEVRAKAINWSDALAAGAGRQSGWRFFGHGRAVVVHHVFARGQANSR